MASRSLSPGGTLLRASRMFSIPAPLPKPIAELGSSFNSTSDTATLPYPVHLSITTTRSSQARGDWGFKRSLPLKSTTKSSTPVIRVDAIDTPEHVTSYTSAADHTLTLEKWQEMNMPLTTPGVREVDFNAKTSPQHGRGVFEDDIDITTAGSSNMGAVESEHRWRFRGPWLAGQTESEFREFLQRTVRKKKAGFTEYLRRHKALQDTKAQSDAARQNSEKPPSAIQPEDITDDELREYLRWLRSDRTILFKLLREFFDLPPSPPPLHSLNSIAESIMESLGSNRADEERFTMKVEESLPTSDSPYANTGPPKTHPSAGLSYLRSGKHIYNHPIYGPQASPPPVQGRVILPRSGTVAGQTPKLGVAGVVTEVPLTHDGGFRSYNDRRGSTAIPGVLNLELDKKGGSKSWLTPTSAHIDPQGRINLKVAPASNAAVVVHEGLEHKPTPTNARRPASPYQPFAKPPRTTSQGYGLGVKDP